MSKKERLEDLGILLVKIENIMEHDLFDCIENIGCNRPKDFIDVFDTLNEDQKEDFLHSLAYNISSVNDMLAECWCIAKGNDEE